MKRRFPSNAAFEQIEIYNAGSIREFEAPIQMASNENCLGPSPLALKAVSKAMKNSNRYPEATGVELRSAIALRLKVKEEEVILGNGSTELVEILLRAYLGTGLNSVTAIPTFIMYRIATLAAYGTCKEVPLRDFRFDLRAIRNAMDKNTRAVLIANPNNPTATMVTRQELHDFLRAVRSDVLVVFDEAYHEYVREPAYPDGIEMMREFSNLIVLRTFSKIHGLAGLRIGYGIANREIIEMMNRVRSPFNTNSMAHAAALAAMEDDRHIRLRREAADRERVFLEKEFRARNIPFVPSVANFFFLPLKNAAAIQQKLLKNGIFVRAFPAGLRVTLGTHKENLSFLNSLCAWRFKG